jgi:hypothetical protein
MDRPVYPITEIEPLVFRFDSIGPERSTRKFVVYQPTSVTGEYNLALLDYVNGRFDDMTKSSQNIVGYATLEEALAAKLARIEQVLSNMKLEERERLLKRQ